MITEHDARDQLVAAADRLFYAQGIQAVGMDAVRAEAGVSLKRIYGLFPSKDDLAVAVLERRTQTWNDGLAAAASDATTPREKILSIFDFLDGWFRSDGFRGCAFINSFGELGSRSPRVAEAVRTQKASFRAYVTELARADGADDETGAQIALLAEGAQTSAAILHDPAVAAQARDAAAVLLERGTER